LEVDELLGTGKGLRAVARFIAVSGAFTFTGEQVDEDGPPDRTPSPRPKRGRRNGIADAIVVDVRNWYDDALQRLAAAKVWPTGFQQAIYLDWFMQRVPQSREAAGEGWEVELLEEMMRLGVFHGHDEEDDFHRRQFIDAYRATHPK